MPDLWPRDHPAKDHCCFSLRQFFLLKNGRNARLLLDGEVFACQNSRSSMTPKAARYKTRLPALHVRSRYNPGRARNDSIDLERMIEWRWNTVCDLVGVLESCSRRKRDCCILVYSSVLLTEYSVCLSQTHV